MFTNHFISTNPPVLLIVQKVSESFPRRKAVPMGKVVIHFKLMHHKNLNRPVYILIKFCIRIETVFFQHPVKILLSQIMFGVIEVKARPQVATDPADKHIGYVRGAGG